MAKYSLVSLNTTGASNSNAMRFGSAIIINAADPAGTIYGQLHGEGGLGVTGGFHNSATDQANRVYGAFAGTR